MRWNDGSARPVPLEGLGQRYRRYRLADLEAEAAMAGSLRRWGQLAPVVVCVRDEQVEVLDGFKRLAAARQIGGMEAQLRSGRGHSEGQRVCHGRPLQEYRLPTTRRTRHGFRQRAPDR